MLRLLSNLEKTQKINSGFKNFYVKTKFSIEKFMCLEEIQLVFCI